MVHHGGQWSNLGGQCFDRLEVEVEVEVKVVKILAMNQKVQHVVALSADLQTDLHPVQCRRLEELGRLERPEQIPTCTTADHSANYTVYTGVTA